MVKWSLADFKTIASIILTLSAAYGTVKGTNAVISHFNASSSNNNENTNKNISACLNICQLKLDEKDKEISQGRNFLKISNEKSDILVKKLKGFPNNGSKDYCKSFKEEIKNVDPSSRLQNLSKISERFLGAKDNKSRDVILNELKSFNPAAAP